MSARKAIPLLLAVLAATGATAQSTVYVTPDVATDPDGGATYLPWDIVRHVNGGPAFYTPELSVPGDPAVDGLHKMDLPGNWLFSVEAPSGLGGLLDVQPEDVVRLDGGIPTLFFDGSCVTPPVPAASNVDALYLFPGDAGDLFLSFDVATDAAGVTYSPNAVVKYGRTGPSPCDWTFGGLEIDLAAVSSAYFPAGANVIGLDVTGDSLLVVFDIPTDLAPTAGPATILTGQIARFDRMLGTWDLFEDLQTQGTPGWPVSSRVDALSCQSNPGSIVPAATPITLAKAGSDVEIQCPGSCSSGGERFGIYEGTLGSLRSGIYDHAAVSCGEACPGSVAVSPGAGNRYYLVVPNNHKEEGSYGLASGPAERPVSPMAANRCAAEQALTPCP